MIEITIDTSDLERKLGGLDIGAMRQAIGVAVGESTKALIAPYPTAARKRQPFKNNAQRRAFFAKLNKGAITVPYRRTGDLGRSWIVEPKGDGAELKNTRGYSELVQSAKGQSGYHKGVWTTDEEAARKMEGGGDAERIASQVVEAALTKAGLS